MTPNTQSDFQPTTKSTTTDITPTKILIVEDNKIDARLIRNAIQQLAGWASAIQVADDGEKAIKLLGGEKGFADAFMPDLVILDLNLPKYDGTEVLQFIRSRQDLESMVVFIFSSSPVDIAEERMHSAKVRADFYFEKPNQFSTYASIAQAIQETYLRVKDSGQKVATA